MELPVKGHEGCEREEENSSADDADFADGKRWEPQRHRG